MSESANLYHIQNIDTQLDKFAKRLCEIEKLLSNNAAMTLASKQFESSKAAFDEARKALNTAENNVEDLDLKIKQNENRLYGGGVKNPKELEDLQIEYNSLQNRRSTLEDIQLNMMIAYEEANDALVNAEKNLKQVEARMIEESAGLRGEVMQIEEKQAKLNVEREALIINVSKENLLQYNNLRVKKNGLAVAAVADDACSGCGSMIRPAKRQEAREGNSLANCSACGRILFVE